MANALLPKHNNTSGVVPASASLQINELAINTADGVAYVKHSDGTVKQIVDPTKLPLSAVTGFATAAQGAKADAALPSASYTAADVKAKLLTVDGIGSGVDADFLRGLPADFTSSIGTYGYQKLPSGLIIQWGVSFLIQGDSVNPVILPVQFTSVVAGIYLQSETTVIYGAERNPIIYAIGLGSFTFRMGAGAQIINARWLAIGY